MVGRITVTQSFTSNLVVAVKTETQEVLVLSESILSRVDGVLCEGFFFLTTTFQFPGYCPSLY